MVLILCCIRDVWDYYERVAGCATVFSGGEEGEGVGESRTVRVRHEVGGFKGGDPGGCGESAADDEVEQASPQFLESTGVGSAPFVGACLHLEIHFIHFCEALHQFPVNAFRCIGGEQVDDLAVASFLKILYQSYGDVFRPVFHQGDASGRYFAFEVEAIRLDDIGGTQPTVEGGDDAHVLVEVSGLTLVVIIRMQLAEHYAGESPDGLYSESLVGELVDHPLQGGGQSFRFGCSVDRRYRRATTP